MAVSLPAKRNLSPVRLLCALLALSSPAAAQGQIPADPSLRVPLEQWGCTNCHLPDASNSARVGQRPGPNLSDVGGRISSAWMKRWIARPADLRAAPTMPRLFGDSAAERADLDAVVAYLADQGRADSVVTGKAIASEEVVLDAGRTLFHTTGCVACHGALESPAAVFGDEFLSQEVPQTFVFASFAALDGKWHPESLSAFLRDPQKVHRDGRMPAMGLDEAQSDAIANYLLSRWKPAARPQVPDGDLVQRGRAVFLQRDCIACHTIDGLEAPKRKTKALSMLDLNSQGPNCLTSAEWNGPRYDFPAPAMARMFTMGVTAANGASIADPQLDYLERQVNRLNCRSCHEMDNKGGLAEPLRVYAISLADDADLGDEGRYPPHLNDVGSKLTTSWFKQVLQESGTARPYLSLRMPQFGAAVDNFPELFAKKAGVQPNSDSTWPPIDDQRVLTGREMLGTDGFSCVTCHSFGELLTPGTPGPDIRQFSGRLRYTWWNAYIKNPEAFKPGTRMPRYTDDQGQGVFTNFYGGDFQKQTDAMWSYFSMGEAMSAPEGVSRGRSLVLQVGTRPRVFRTFLDSAGARGIAVGFPVGLHFAYDANGGGLREIWQGSFIDASGAWAGRGGNSTGAGGEVLWTGAASAVTLTGEIPAHWPDASAVEFRGYRLEKDGTPVFLLESSGVRVEERIVPHASPQRSFERRLRFVSVEVGRPLYLRQEGTLLSSDVKGGQLTQLQGPAGEMIYRVDPTHSECTVTLEVKL